MSEQPYHNSLRLRNFTVFKDAEIEFSPGVNAFIGENGSGKTHLLKAMYAYQRPMSRDVPDIATVLARLFQTENVGDIVRSQSKSGGVLEVGGKYGGKEWAYGVQKTTSHPSAVKSVEIGMAPPVFIPAIDMMGHTKGFREAYNSVFLDFDLTCYDILNLFNLKHRESIDRNGNNGLNKLLGGDVVADESTGRFYLQTPTERVEMPMVAEGIRKLAAVVRLQNNNWLTPGTTLYWDEPEANINPVFMDELVASIIAMARQGVQIFLATHSYVILKELDLQATQEDRLRFFSLHGRKAGTRVTSADSLPGIAPNPILAHYSSLYDRDLDRALGKGPRRGSL